MSADRLREAARVLRESVEDVPLSHPWRSVDRGPVDLALMDTVGRHVLPPATYNGEDEYIYSYIATMHPGVALALADWLDDEALRDSYLPASARTADLILGDQS